MMSPGSFSDESILEVDRSGAARLFLRTAEESPLSREFIDAEFDAIGRLSQTAEIRVLEGRGHATGMFEGRPRLVDEIADWLSDHLRAR